MQPAHKLILSVLAAAVTSVGSSHAAVLWTTTFSASPATDGTNRNLTNTTGEASFTDALSADDANLTFQDTTFNGSVVPEPSAALLGGQGLLALSRRRRA